MSTDRDGVATENFLRLRINDDNLRMEILFVLGHGQSFLAGRLIGLGLNGDTSDHVAELNLTTGSGNNGDGVRIPGQDGLVLLHVSSVRDRDDRTNNHIVGFQLKPILITDGK